MRSWKKPRTPRQCVADVNTAVNIARSSLSDAMASAWTAVDLNEPPDPRLVAIGKASGQAWKRLQAFKENELARVSERIDDDLAGQSPNAATDESSLWEAIEAALDVVNATVSSLTFTGSYVAQEDIEWALSELAQAREDLEATQRAL